MRVIDTQIGLATLNEFPEPRDRNPRWRIPMLEPFYPTTRGNYQSWLKTNALDAYSLTMVCLYFWLQVRKSTTAIDAEAKIIEQIEQRGGRCSTARRRGSDQDELFSVQGSIKRGKQLIADRTPYKTDDEIRQWFDTAEKRALSEYIEHRKRTEHNFELTLDDIERRRFESLHLLDRTYARAEEVESKIVMRRKRKDSLWHLETNSFYIPETWKLYDLYEAPQGYSLKNFIEFHQKYESLTVPTLSECFQISIGSWINAADLWSCYQHYRPVFDVAVLLGRISSGFPIRMSSKQARLLYVLLGLGQLRFRDQTIQYAIDFSNRNDLQLGTQDLKQQHKDNCETIKEILMLVTDFDSVSAEVGTLVSETRGTKDQSSARTPSRSLVISQRLLGEREAQKIAPPPSATVSPKKGARRRPRARPE